MDSNKNYEIKVCICIPTYNSAKTISKTIDSLLNQTYKNLNILVTDNASTDNTVKIVKQYIQKHKIIKIFESKENIGGEGNFTRCIKLARDQYTAIFHSDDIYEANMVEKQVLFLEKNKNAGAVFTGARWIDEHDKTIGKAFMPKHYTQNNWNNKTYDFNFIFKDILKYGNFLTCPSAMVRTAIFKEEIKNWRGDIFHTSADLDVWLRILENHNIGIIHEKLMRYRISSFDGTYRYNNLRTSRHDFFLVTDYYLKQEWVSILVSSKDLQNYKQLETWDQLKIATSFLKLNKWECAKKICKEMNLNKMFTNVFTKFKGLKAFILITFIHIAIIFRGRFVSKLINRYVI